MQEFDKSFVEKILSELDDNSWLFPQFMLKKSNSELKLLGTGGFSVVYEMCNKERMDTSFAMKVIGFQRHTVSSEEFRNTTRMQWILCQESEYIMRILDSRELTLLFDDNGIIKEVKDASKEIWEENKNTLRIQCVLMERLDELILKDRFASVKLLRKELATESEVFKFAFEIGQALAAAHNNKCLHRDIKIENIFWDKSEQVYKLGDFGIAKWTEDGSAETVVYTDGYGAPEIERRLYGSYNATADIYSFGITLYLLLNDFRFPGSDGYYSKVDVQYNPEFVFPAPVHASQGMSRIIRKMCSFYPEDRYQSMGEVLSELSMVLDSMNEEVSDDLYELADLATETYKEEKNETSDNKNAKKHIKTRAEKKEEQKIIDSIYREESIKYLILFTVLLTLLFKGLQPDSSMINKWMFFVLPAALIFESIFQTIKEFHLFFGTVILVLTGISIYTIGLTVPHILVILCVLIGCPILTFADAVSTLIWGLLEITNNMTFLDYINKWDLGWIIFVVTLIVLRKYFDMRINWEKTTYIRALLGTIIYDILVIIMIIAGIVIVILKKCDMIIVPDVIERMHLVKTGAILFFAMCVLAWLNGFFEETEDNLEECEEAVGEDAYLD